ncbi:hypothetical protein D3C76_1409620 [compost metagenome]
MPVLSLELLLLRPFQAKAILFHKLLWFPTCTSLQDDDGSVHPPCFAELYPHTLEVFLLNFPGD